MIKKNISIVQVSIFLLAVCGSVFLMASSVQAAGVSCTCVGKIELNFIGKTAVKTSGKEAELKTMCSNNKGTYSDYSCSNAQIKMVTPSAEACTGATSDDLLKYFGVPSYLSSGGTITASCKVGSGGSTDNVCGKSDCLDKVSLDAALKEELCAINTFKKCTDTALTCCETPSAAAAPSASESGTSASSGGSSSGESGSSLASKLIPDCALQDKMDKSSPCRNINIFVVLLIQIAGYLFTFIGGLALLVFVYGGFVLILSQGNPEKVKQGTGAMISAVIGLLVAFGGYLLISFLGELVGLGKAFILK